MAGKLVATTEVICNVGAGLRPLMQYKISSMAGTWHSPTRILESWTVTASPQEYV